MKKLINSSWLQIFIIVMGFVSLLFLLTIPRIHLKGKDTLILDVYGTYKEPGYSASFLFHDLTENIEVTSNVDMNTIGTYEVQYRLNYGIYHVKEKRVVSVVDKKKPEIILKGSNPVSVCPSKTYDEEGYEVIDNYDLDITSKVIIESDSEKITYTVSDSSNNTASIQRKIVYEDIEAPVITLAGGSDMTLSLGESYVDPGYMAIDNCDLDITSNVNVIGNVDTNHVGNYTLTYESVDTSGNKATAIRNVNVVKNTNGISGVGKVIYLTFDDGPSRSITPSVLQILREENVKATFFVINHDDSLNYLIKQASDEGHTVALHSYTHDYGYIYSSIENYFNDLSSIENKVESITGKKSKIIRFPGGSSNTVSRKYQVGIMSTLSNEVLNRGYIYFDWNVSSGDAGGARTKDDVYFNVVNNLYYQNNIVLLHDFENNYKTLNALRDIIRYGKNNGYTFKAITEETVPSRHKVNN